MNKANHNWYSTEDLAEARKYWRLLTVKELQDFYTADMQNPYKSDMKDYTFNEWLIVTARQSAYEIAHDI